MLLNLYFYQFKGRNTVDLFCVFPIIAMSRASTNTGFDVGSTSPRAPPAERNAQVLRCFEWFEEEASFLLVLEAG